MQAVQKSLRIRPKIFRAMLQIARDRGADFSSIANELLDEATRMRLCPGIVFAQGPTGARARITGTGIDAWEVVANYKSLKNNFDRLAKAYPHLSEAQLLAALNYYHQFRPEIDRRIRANAAWTPAKLRARYPFAVGEIR